jgi:SOS response regulatory protein OraA/RecX
MPSNTCSVTDLKIELAKAGVDSSTIKAAEEAASKQKKGNVYYSISTI